VTDAERGAALEAIAAEIRVCTRCRLHENRAKAVPGEGNPDTEVVIVGEGPGRDENQAGRPFVGASGRLLTELIESLGWQRDDVFITNVVKCWPPGNRDPAPDEIAACAPYLHRQLEVLDPAVIVTAGKHSLGVFMPGERISRVHGTARPADPATGARDALVLAMYHPAFALYDGSNRSTLFTDIQGLPTTLEAARTRRAARGPEAGAGSDAAAAAGGFDAPAPAQVPGILDHVDAPVRAPDEPPSGPGPTDAPQLVAAAAGSGSEADPDADQLTLF
jgi:DNA polymerase